MVKAQDSPSDLRRKLALLEGDRKAFFESSQATIKVNAARINELRKENKMLATKLKSWKGPRKSTVGRSPAAMTEKVAEQVKKLNALRADSIKRERQLEQLTKEVSVLEQELQSIAKSNDSPEAQQLRTLENRLDKATIKAEEAHHIGQTYETIIKKMKQERLGFDQEIGSAEQAIAARKREIVELEAMHNDACLSRDHVRQELAAQEQEFNEAREQRQKEKRDLDTLAEERRRQYEAIEKRLRLQSVGPATTEAPVEVSEEKKQQAMTYEQAMARIQETTGVHDISEVVDRFLAQGQTQERLQDLQKSNVEKLQHLREEYSQLSKQFEALKYSGEARNTSNQRMLKEFEQHLTDTEARCDTAKQQGSQVTRVLVDVKSGIDHLHHKLEKLKPVQFRAAANAQDKLTESELRLKSLADELESRRAELPAGAESEVKAFAVLPAHNTRIKVQAPPTKDDSDSEDDDMISRDAMKRQAQAVVDSKTTKKRVPSKKKKR
eukprot:m.190209 g.190209  ORF g.190209 m.190209 type:complete len:496 (-) comp18223_c2_seq1:98-1585(-)